MFGRILRYAVFKPAKYGTQTDKRHLKPSEFLSYCQR